MTALGWRRWVPIPLGLVLGLASGSVLDALNVADGAVATIVSVLVVLHALALCFVPPFSRGSHRALDHDLRRQLWLYSLPVLAAGVSLVWALSGLSEAGTRLHDGTRVFMLAAPSLGVAWSVDQMSRRFHLWLGHGWTRTPLSIAACWGLAMATALLLAVGAPRVVYYPILGPAWLERTPLYFHDYPWIVRIVLTLSAVHATTLSVLVPISEALWRWTPPAPTPARPWALYAILPAALVQLAWLGLAYTLL